jgi:solute carrier family 31 (copper transporter), member 1
MLWNWYTVDSCFISSSWHITSAGMFAGSCIGVICLVVLLEFLRRLGKEYDRKILHDYQDKIATSGTSDGMNKALVDGQGKAMVVFRPSILQQAVRALLHMLAFAVAYLVML